MLVYNSSDFSLEDLCNKIIHDINNWLIQIHIFLDVITSRKIIVQRYIYVQWTITGFSPNFPTQVAERPKGISPRSTLDTFSSLLNNLF